MTPGSHLGPSGRWAARGGNNNRRNRNRSVKWTTAELHAKRARQGAAASSTVAWERANGQCPVDTYLAAGGLWMLADYGPGIGLRLARATYHPLTATEAMARAKPDRPPARLEACAVAHEADAAELVADVERITAYRRALPADPDCSREEFARLMAQESRFQDVRPVFLP
jgi:hypothetical protein